MLKAYMMHAGEPCDGAALVFAKSFREAKRLAFNGSCVCDGCDYIDVRGHQLKNDVWLRNNAADQEKIVSGISHVVDDVPCCKGCDLWYEELEDSGYCSTCHPDQEDANV